MELLILILLGAIWGASFLFMRIAAPIVGPVSLIQWRLVFATLFLVPFSWQARKLKKEDVNHLLVLAVFNTALPFTLLAYTTTHLSAGFSSMMNATAPFFSVLFGALLFQSRISARQGSGLALGFLGTWILLAGKVSLKESASENLFPVLAGILAAACYGFAANFGKRKLSHLNPIFVSFWNCLFASLALLPLSYNGPQAWNFSPLVLGSAIALGVLCTAIAYLLYFRLLVKSGATKALLVTFLIPVFACLWGWIFLNEAITLQTLIGAAFVFWGIARMTGK